MKVKLLSRVRLFATPCTVAYYAPPPMGFPRQEYWSGVPFPEHHPVLLLLLLFFVPGDSTGKEPACQCRSCKRWGFNPWVGKIPWRREWQSTPVLLPGKSHGQKSLVGYSLWSHKELDMTEQLHFT